MKFESVVSILAMALIAYFSGAFINASMDITTWTNSARYFTTAFWLGLSVVKLVINEV